MPDKATELCVLLVEEIFGESPAAVFTALMTYGRQQSHGLERYTGLTPTQIRQGLAVLIQQHLAVWSSGSPTFYEANWSGAYALVRSGKFSKAAGDRLDLKAELVLSRCLVDGYAKAADLERSKVDVESPNHRPSHANGVNGTSHGSHEIPESYASSIYNMLEVGVVMPCNPSHFRSKVENRARAEKDVRARKIAWKDKIKPVDRPQFRMAIDQTVHDWKYGSKSVRKAIQQRALGEPITLMDEFKTVEEVHEENTQRPSKRLKMSHGIENGSSFYAGLMIRANHNKYPVMIRSQRLVQLAADRIGAQTSRVYATVLYLLDEDIMECSEFKRDAETPVMDEELEQPTIGTKKILEAIDDFESLRASMGTSYDTERAAPRSGSPSATKQTQVKKPRRLSDSGDNRDAEVNSESDADVVQRKRTKAGSKTKDRNSATPMINGKGHNPAKMTIAYEAASIDDDEDDLEVLNRDILLQHLLVLADHNLLIHHAPSKTQPSKGRDRWSVPFAALSHELRLLEINTSLVAHFGTPALRIVRILQAKGRLDEKTLISQALLDTKTVRSALSAMCAAGYMELQELPRDNNRAPSKTLYLWFFDEKRCAAKLLEHHYTAMSRCFQRLKLERQHVRDLLVKSARTDVKGNEKEFLLDDELNRMAKWKAIEEKLLLEIDRLDDSVLLLRDL